ncbi:phospho-N-acetylmuramoyl-pentapeptide-transferase [Lentisphaerota bacterium ZTH]|nr:phospho-N-acetylmuramoyl-pentapeptide-transferase [Lentisphaerota bacterium]WET07435.1 phospho-N-acetylmuramoyl-pentapeptide-transferase [Lentisphaerota bacterium ZTH]
MLYWLSDFDKFFGPLRLFEYVTFRAGGAAFTAFAITLLLGPYVVRKLKAFNANAPCRYQGIMDEEYIDRAKDKTPSMGGILLISAVVFSVLLWNKLSNPIPLILLAALVLFGLLGFIDDFAKVAYNRRDGIPGKMKLLAQFVIAGVAVLSLNYLPETRNLMEQLMLPFLKEPVLKTPWVMLFSTIVVVGASNAVNLTDGKDGLAAGCSIFCALTYAVMAYLYGHAIFAKYLHVPFIPGVSEAVVFAAAIVGACIGFLWHNCHPAAMFMGDTGSLALGGSIGLIAVLVRQEILLALVGGVFVLEALSVIIQVTSFKLTGKRVFLCTPIHHHFERKDWTETQIVVRFWILAGIFALMALATLKLR